MASQFLSCPQSNQCSNAQIVAHDKGINHAKVLLIVPPSSKTTIPWSHWQMCQQNWNRLRLNHCLFIFKLGSDKTGEPGNERKNANDSQKTQSCLLSMSALLFLCILIHCGHQEKENERWRFLCDAKLMPKPNYTAANCHVNYFSCVHRRRRCSPSLTLPCQFGFYRLLMGN